MNKEQIDILIESLIDIKEAIVDDYKNTRERSIAITKIDEALLWLGIAEKREVPLE